MRKQLKIKKVVDYENMDEFVFTIDDKYQVASQKDFEKYCLDAPRTENYICMSTYIDTKREFMPA